MDAQDALNINTQIQNINSNINNLTDSIRNDHTLNFEMIERFKNITDHINKEQTTIETFLKNTANKIKREHDILIETQYLNQLNFNIDLLTNHLSNIAEAVILSKLNIIPKLLLTYEELSNIKDKLQKQNININALEQVYEFLKLQAYYNESNIIFNIRIPIVSKEKYHLYHIIPLPINNTKLITVKPYINYNENHIHYFETLCPKIEATYYCSTPILEEDASNSACIGKLMNNMAAHCPLSDVGRIETITQPQPNFILFINVHKLIINSTCSSKSFSIEGTSLVHFKGCNVEANGITYQDDTETYWDAIHVPPPPSSSIYSNTTTEVLSLQKLKDYSFTTETRLFQLGFTTEILNYATGTSICLCSLTIIIVTIIVIRRRTYNPATPDSTTSFRPSSAPAQMTSFQSFSPSMTSLWPSLYSKGGGVTEPNMPATCSHITP